MLIAIPCKRETANLWSHIGDAQLPPDTLQYVTLPSESPQFAL